MKMENVAANIKRLISSHGSTIKQFAVKCCKPPNGVAERTLYSTLSGKYNTSFETLNKIADTLEVPLSCLFEEDDSQVKYVLSDSEKRLIDLHRQMNDKTRERLIGYAEALPLEK